MLILGNFHTASFLQDKLRIDGANSHKVRPSTFDFKTLFLYLIPCHQHFLLWVLPWLSPPNMLPRWSFSTLITLATLTIGQRPPPVAPCVPGPVFGTRCVIECGVNRPGQAHSSYKVSSFQACITECDIDWHCVTAQYERASRICHLKSTISPSRADRAIDGVTCGGGTLFPSATPVSAAVSSYCLS